MRYKILLVLFVLAGLAGRSPVVHADQLCFPGTTVAYCFDAAFAPYWQANGGLPVFGYPITAAADELNRDTQKTYLTQWAERNRFELHPENAGTPYAILLGRLGAERLSQLQRDPATEGREAGPQAGCLWFEETGHNVCDQSDGLGFKTYWQTHGLAIDGLDAYARSLQLFGLPLTAPKMETNSSGDTVLTQWFERARFEWHPNNPNEFKVLLGLLGTEVRNFQFVPPPPPPPTDFCQNIAPPTVGSMSDNCFPAGDAFEVVVTGLNKGDDAGYYVNAPDNTTFMPPIIAGEGRVTAEGRYRLKIALPAYSPTGDYRLIIEVNETIFVFPFRIIAGPPTNGDQSKLPANINVVVYPEEGARGDIFTFSTTGFNPGENVAVYGIDPYGTMIPSDIHLKADGNGNVGSRLSFSLEVTDPLGVYTTVFESLDDGKKAIGYLRIVR